MNISYAAHMILQAAAFVVQGAVAITSLTPDKWKPYVLAAISAAQGILANFGQKSDMQGNKLPENPTGEPLKPQV